MIKFTKSAKYDYDFKKGDKGTVERVISPFPRATDTIYLVLHEESTELMWVTGKDIVPFDQLEITEWGYPVRGRENDTRCTATLSGYGCCMWEGHNGKHVAYAGWEWSEINSDRNQGITKKPAICDG